MHHLPRQEDMTYTTVRRLGIFMGVVFWVFTILFASDALAPNDSQSWLTTVFSFGKPAAVPASSQWILVLLGGFGGVLGSLVGVRFIRFFRRFSPTHTHTHMRA